MDWHFSIQDNGIGIDEKKHKQSFQDTFDVPNRDQYGGTE
jgi:light-regulated signal transduction histidine kinase (bacteriophytochrome)